MFGSQKTCNYRNRWLLQGLKDTGLNGPTWVFWVANITCKKLDEIYRNIESHKKSLVLPCQDVDCMTDFAGEATENEYRIL